MASHTLNKVNTCAGSPIEGKMQPSAGGTEAEKERVSLGLGPSWARECYECQGVGPCVSRVTGMIESGRMRRLGSSRTYSAGG